ncbi:MAG: hypothetical protein ACYDCL_11090 [Myxococcales bacterium]
MRIIVRACSIAVAAGALAACSGGGAADSGAITSCADPALEVYFSPMYSANDGQHEFQIPSIVSGIQPSDIAWYASDPSMVSLTPDPTLGGVMITTKASGTVDILPLAGGLCGSSTLTITSNTPDDWQAGNERYNDGIDLRDGGRFGGLFGCDGGECNTIACTTCHGATATGPFQDVAHTPQQTGGFSDSDLDNIIRNGQVPGWSCNTDGGGGYGPNAGKWSSSTPDAGYFDESIVKYCEWSTFHRWVMSDAELTGVICYLRSLTPTPQNGQADFGGHGPGGGGYHGGGGSGGGGSSSSSSSGGTTG